MNKEREIVYTKAQRRYYSNVKKSAKKRKIPFELKMNEIYSVLEKQEYKCALTGLPIEVLGKDAASLDRINNSLPYNKKNIQWLHKDVNNMKGYFKDEYFLNLCALIVKKNKK